MMKTWKFYGSSDDLAEIECSDKFMEELSYFSSPMALELRDQESGDRLHVHFNYDHASSNGCWNIGISQAEEGVPIPDWAFRYETAPSEYSVLLLIETPDTVTMTQSWPVEEE